MAKAFQLEAPAPASVRQLKLILIWQAARAKEGETPAVPEQRHLQYRLELVDAKGHLVPGYFDSGDLAPLLTPAERAAAEALLAAVVKKARRMVAPLKSKAKAKGKRK